MIDVIRRLAAAAPASLAIAVVALAPLAARAETLASWDPSGTINSSTPLAPSSVSASLTSAGNLSLGPGLSDPGAFANAFVGNNWPSGALDANDFLDFSTNGSVTYQSVVFSLYNNFDGTGNWELRSSVDAYTSALASGSFSGIFGGGLLINADISALGTQSGTVEFRLYTFNNDGTTNPLQRGIRGTGGGGQGLVVNGTAAGVITPFAGAPLDVPTLGSVALLVLMVVTGIAGLALVRRTG